MSKSKSKSKSKRSVVWVFPWETHPARYGSAEYEVREIDPDSPQADAVKARPADFEPTPAKPSEG